jgi:ribosomal protein L4
LIATAGHAPMIYKSARNIPAVNVLAASDLNALAILKPHRLVIAKEAMDQLKNNTQAEANS